MRSLSIAKRFCGPPTSANGGYFAGMAAGVAGRPSFAVPPLAMQSPPGQPPPPRLSTQPLSVRLKAPPPLDTELVAVETPDGGYEVRDGERLIGSVSLASLNVPVPAPVPGAAAVGYDEAVEASRNYIGFANHRFPTCFVCGVSRHQGDGLCIYAGAVAGRDAAEQRVVAAPWTPEASLDSGDGTVRPEFMWAALDCPGYYAVTPDDRMMLLAQFTAELYQPVRVDEPCVVVGWGIGSNGSKHEAGTALYGRDGELRGRAWALWIEPRSTQ